MCNCSLLFIKINWANGDNKKNVYTKLVNLTKKLKSGSKP